MSIEGLAKVRHEITGLGGYVPKVGLDPTGVRPPPRGRQTTDASIDQVRNRGRGKVAKRDFPVEFELHVAKPRSVCGGCDDNEDRRETLKVGHGCTEQGRQACAIQRWQIKHHEGRARVASKGRLDLTHGFVNRCRSLALDQGLVNLVDEIGHFAGTLIHTHDVGGTANASSNHAHERGTTGPWRSRQEHHGESTCFLEFPMQPLDGLASTNKQVPVLSLKRTLVERVGWQRRKPVWLDHDRGQPRRGISSFIEQRSTFVALTPVERSAGGLNRPPNNAT